MAGRKHSFSAIIILLLLFFFNCSHATRATSITTDQDALLAFKAHITSDPQNLIASNWSTTASVCDWIGITCGTHHRRVTSVVLEDMGLTGTISPHIGNLSFLVNFSLYDNHFHGSLPVELASLRRLKSLELTFNLFNGIIPSWIGSFNKLLYLALYSNNFGGGFPVSVCNLTQLKHLDFGINNLEGQIPEAIFEIFYNLNYLSLTRNKFSGGVPVGIFNISSLVIFDLSHNWLSGSIPTTFRNKSNPLLRILSFGINNLTGNIPSDMFSYFPALEYLANLLTGPIPSTLFACKRLQKLSLSYNHLEGDIHKDFGNLTLLQELYLGYNNFKGDIPNSVGNLINLELLILRRNSIDGEIQSSIGNLTRLIQLDLAENKLKGSIPFEMGNHAYLEYLDLGTNSLHGMLPSSIFNISTLKWLDLNTNNLSGSLPPNFGLHLPNLEGIYIARNNFHGPIPTSLTNASELVEMDLGLNMFFGSIPVALGNLRKLEFLNLGVNKLHTQSLSTLFSSLANCRTLTTLELSENPLNASLPISAGNLSSSLEFFFIDDIGLTGTIHKEICNLSNLISLDLGRNNLTGFIPETIGNLRKLQALDLNFNRIQGTIPSELCGLQSLSEIYFGGNDLFGKVPSCFGNLISLRKLYLGSNRLNSTLPSTLWTLRDILFLDLSSNSLSGELPLEIGNLKAVAKLNFSGNQLSGSIPATFGGLQYLTDLYLSNNRLEGSIPEALGDAISLELLDLSINNLSGEIPKSLEKLKYLKDFNVSFNELQGEIPNRGPFTSLSAPSFKGNKALCGAPKFQVHACETSRKNQSKSTKMPLIVIGTIVLALGTLIIILIWYFKRKPRLSTQQGNFLSLETWKRISSQELERATNNFDEVNFLGKGGFGSVYKGTLSDGTFVAVKVFNLEVQGAFKSFDVECEVLRMIRHRNLVKIITSCCTTTLKALVMEFMPNYTLEKWLYSHNYFLDIWQRLNIMIDVASALEYIHHGTMDPIVHCDLKPNNILLDDDMVAHVTDFGIAKLVGEDQSIIQTMTLATVGYMAPEYGSEGLVSIKGDVYSFGILLMEAFTRKRPMDEMFNEEMSIKQWIKELLPSGVAQLADPNLLMVNEQHHLAKTDCIHWIMDLALRCSVDAPEERISSKEVVSALNKIKDKLLKDVQQTFNR